MSLLVLYVAKCCMDYRIAISIIISILVISIVVAINTIIATSITAMLITIAIRIINIYYYYDYCCSY